MCRERIVIEFDLTMWGACEEVKDIVALEQAVHDGDYATVAEYLKIADADDIRLERQEMRWPDE